jgi:hypothetical protein
MLIPGLNNGGALGQNIPFEPGFGLTLKGVAYFLLGIKKQSLALKTTSVTMANAAHTLVVGTALAAQTKLLGNMLFVDPGGTAAPVLTLPAAADLPGVPLTFYNSGTATGDLVVADASGTTVLRVAKGKVGFLLNDGVTWGGLTADTGTAASTVLLPDRYTLIWKAGERGVPGLKADITSAVAATQAAADPLFEIQGTNSTSALSTSYGQGGVTLTTAGADNDQMILVPHTDAKQSGWGLTQWGTGKSLSLEQTIWAGGDITTCIYWAGLKLTSTQVVATDDNQAYFRYQSGVNSGKWQFIYSIAGVDTTVDTGVLCSATVHYHFRITVDANRIARAYINEALVATSTALTNAVNLIPYIGVQASGGAVARLIRVQGAAISRISG